MKFTIGKDAIVKSLKPAASVAGKKSSLLILSYIRFSAGEQRLTVYATDAEMGFEARHAVEVEEPGAICLPAKVLHDIIASLPDGPVGFTTDDRLAVTIRSESGFYRIIGLSPEEFPGSVIAADNVLLPVPASDLRNLISMVLHAASTDVTRANICGALLQLAGADLLMVATDGHCLAKALRGVVGPELAGLATDCGLAKGVIIPRRALQELLYILDKRLEASVSIGATGNMFILRIFSEALTFHVALIDGDYPDYGRVLPKEVTAPVVIRRAPLLESLRRLNILAGEHGVLDLGLEGNTLRLTVDNPDLAMENHPLQIMNASALEITEKDYVGIVMPLKM